MWMHETWYLMKTSYQNSFPFRENFLLTSMETILIIPGELKYLEGLIKLVRRKKDVETI
jgi:hypothetical protein